MAWHNMKSTTGSVIALTALLFAAGCASSNPPTFGERLQEQGDRVEELGERWEEGTQLVEEGRAQIAKGREQLSSGEENIAEGEAKVDKGQRLIDDSENAYRRLQEINKAGEKPLEDTLEQ